MRKPRAGRSDWLLLVLLALAAVVVWIFTTSQPVDNSATALANPLGEGNAATNQESTNGAATTEASTERAISTLASRVKVVGQVACPDWATPPGEIVIDLRPQAGTEAEARRIRVYADRLHFEFANIKAGNWELEARADGFQSFKALYTFTPGQRRISLLVLIPLVPSPGHLPQVAAAEHVRGGEGAAAERGRHRRGDLPGVCGGPGHHSRL